jgi:hypothetical protein
VATRAEQNTFNYSLSQARPYWVYSEPRYGLIDVTTKQPCSVVWFYPTPNQDYTAQLMVKQLLTQVDYHDELVQFPPYVLIVLKYEVAILLAGRYGTQLSTLDMAMYQKALTQVKALNNVDLNVRTDNPFKNGRRFRPWGTYVL